LLAGVGAECLNLGFQIFPDLDMGCAWSHGDGLAAGEDGITRGIVQLLYPVSHERVAQLVRKAIAASRPVEGQSGEDRRHAVIGVAGRATGRIKCQQNLRSKIPDVQG
jgi:hypothetical protein